MKRKLFSLLALALALPLAACAGPQTAPAAPSQPSSSSTSAASVSVAAAHPKSPWLEVDQDAYELPGESAVEIAYTLHNEDGLADQVEFPALAWRDETGEWMAVEVRVGICGVPDPLGPKEQGTLNLNELFELPGDGEYRLSFCVLGPDGYRTTAADTFTLTLKGCAE